MDEKTKISFEFAKSVTIQLLTVSSGLIALGVTFLEKIHTKSVPECLAEVLIASWISLTISILGGFWSILAQTGTLAKLSDTELTIYRGNILLPSGIQVVTFFFGIVLTVLYGGLSLSFR